MVFKDIVAAKMLVCSVALIGLTGATWTPMVRSAEIDQRWAQPVRRSTTDRDHDLVDALIDHERFDEALKICLTGKQRTEPNSDEAAKWSIRHSQVLSAQQTRADRFDDERIILAQAPVTELLNRYPDHRRRWFLRWQQIAVMRDAANHAVQRAVTTSAKEEREVAVRRLLTATTQTEQLIKQMTDEIVRLNTSSQKSDLALAKDLDRLRQQLRVEVVSLDLMQTELFTSGTDDLIAAATKAEQSAVNAIATLPVGTPARTEIERLRVEAILRAGQLDRAEQALDEFVDRLAPPLPPRVQALQVRLDLAKGNLDQAKRHLQMFYGDSPVTAPRSIEMDLARLEYLIRGEQKDAIAPWLDVIQQRGGQFARRRAETRSLQLLGNRGTSDSMRGADPSIIAAQGQDWLRRGEPGRAGEMLAAAATNDRDPNRALVHAMQAAAAFVSADRNRDAAKILETVALKHADQQKSAQLHLQAIYLTAAMDEDQIADRVEAMLKQHLKQWSTGPTANTARDWLARIYSAQHRYLEAAETVTDIPVEAFTDEAVDKILAHWRDAFRNSDEETRSYLSQRLHAVFAPLIKNDRAFSAYRLAAALWMQPDELRSLPRFDDPSPDAAFVDALIEFRKDSRITPELRNPPSQWIDDASWRLMQDGRQTPAGRRSIAELVNSWHAPDEISIDRAERLIWLGQSDEAMSVIRRLIQAAPDSTAVIQQAASVLGSSRDRESQAVAVKLWDDLASGTKAGTSLWHRAKIAAIELLKKLGRDDEARRRARYILLTVPHIDEEFKWRYEAAIL